MYGGNTGQYTKVYNRDGKSPQLHHPVPQHPIPPMRSPSNLEDMISPQDQQKQQRNTYQTSDNPDSNGWIFSNYNSYSKFVDDPTTKIGLDVGKNAFIYGQDYVARHIPQSMQMSALRYYFQVSNIYVLRKLGLVLFPWRHKPWTRQLQRSESGGQVVETYATARDDINAPDMYIPFMAFTTYILLNCVLSGLHGSFHPQIIRALASSTVAYLTVELLLLKLGTYLLSADSKLLDFIAYSGYKFIGIVVTMLMYAVIPWSTLKWGVFLYTATSNSFFLLRSLRYVLLPDSNAANTTTHTVNPSQRQKRIQFLFVYSFVCQFVFMWFLTM